MGQTDDTYQGWANRETWEASLHLSNDYGLYTDAREVMQRAVDRAKDPGPYTAANALEDWFGALRDAWCDEPADVSDEVAMMMREVGSWWRVDWREVADRLMGV